MQRQSWQRNGFAIPETGHVGWTASAGSPPEVGASRLPLTGRIAAMMGRSSPLMSEGAFPWRVVNMATVAWSEDTSRTTPGRAGALLGLLGLGGENVSGAGVANRFVLVIPEMAERLELSKKKL